MEYEQNYLWYHYICIKKNNTKKIINNLAIVRYQNVHTYYVNFNSNNYSNLGFWTIDSLKNCKEIAKKYISYKYNIGYNFNVNIIPNFYQYSNLNKKLYPWIFRILFHFLLILRCK